jgi:hypothetical protein
MAHGSNPSEGEIFRTRPGTHPAPYTRVTRSSPWAKRSRRGIDNTPHQVSRFDKEYSYTSTSPLGFHGLFQGELYFTFYSRHDSRSQKRNVSAGISKSLQLKSCGLLSLSYLLHIASTLTLGTSCTSSLNRQIGGFL